MGPVCAAKGEKRAVTGVRRPLRHLLRKCHLPLRRGGKPLRRGRTDSTRKGHAASVTLLRREQLRKVVRPYKVHCVEAGNVPLLAEGDVWHILF